MCFRKKNNKLLSFAQMLCLFSLTLHYTHIFSTCLSLLKYIIFFYNSVLTCFSPFPHLSRSHSSFTTQLTWLFWPTPSVKEGSLTLNSVRWPNTQYPTLVEWDWQQLLVIYTYSWGRRHLMPGGGGGAYLARVGKFTAKPLFLLIDWFSFLFFWSSAQ